MHRPSDTLRQAQGRTALLRMGFALMFLILALRAGEVASWPPPPQPHPYEEPQRPRRGNIVDARGALLATDIAGQSLYADPHLIAEPDTTAQALARIFPNAGDMTQKLRQDARFVWLARHISPAQARAVLEIGEPGLVFRAEPERVYPQGPLAAHLIGHTDVDGRGLAGVERAFDGALAAGQDVRLTIDIRLQHALEREIGAAMETFSAKAGAGAILEIATGRVLAGASLPDFDPARAGAASADRRFNRLTLGVYELGSLFKVFSTAAFLEAYPKEGLAARFDTREPLRSGRFVIRDYHPEERILTTAEVFEHSSNIGAALMAERVGTERLKAFYAALGLLEPMPAWPLSEVGRPLVPRPWRDISTLTVSYGHGIAVSPLQLATAAAAVLGDGRLRAPKIVEEIGAPVAARQVLSTATAQTMHTLARLVVTGGTAKEADVLGYAIGGKTGTAEKPGATGGYDSTRIISSFVGVFPAHAPRYLILIMVDEPKGTKASYGYATGGWVAAPAVARLVQSMAHILMIPPIGESGNNV
ncbi:MAG TPA: penicillin-binding protein 2 [Rhodospirillaceae bacterium]|jgi:cell division protein FtsI (penicillin-binding protein 3)|nr:penicillin-binding protein 2 [Alphaproteobacteria bacterium]HBH27162.1 penicillin-binding protein 2 [Rhodospirillaceae bacterium]